MGAACRPPPGLRRAALLRSRAMSGCALEPRPPGKRWLVSGGREGGGRRRGSRGRTPAWPLSPRFLASALAVFSVEMGLCSEGLQTPRNPPPRRPGGVRSLRGFLGALFAPLPPSAPAWGALPPPAWGAGGAVRDTGRRELPGLSFPGAARRWPAWGTPGCPARGTAWGWRCWGSWRGGWGWRRAGPATAAAPPTSPWPRWGTRSSSCSGRGGS